MEPWLENFARANFRRSSDTAHDLKTPLNVAVLNLELLRMRVRKLTGGDDEKLTGYAQALETELRRMGKIFDSFFLLSTPPKNEELADIDIGSVCADAATTAGFTIDRGEPVHLFTHEARIRQAVKMFFEGASKVLADEGRQASALRNGHEYSITVAGTLEPADLELTKVFKFYYTDPLGNPDLSLASARLIVETYGGEINASGERDKVSLRLSFPLGER